MRPQHRFTVYDAMEAKGVFAQNPANIDSRDSQGLSNYKKEEYPRMVYHPKGEERITNPAEIIATPLGPKEVGEQRMLISKIVNNAEEHKAATKEGWHDTPARSVAVRTGVQMPESPAEEIARLNEQIRELRAQGHKAESEALANPPKGKTVSAEKVA